MGVSKSSVLLSKMYQCEKQFELRYSRSRGQCFEGGLPNGEVSREMAEVLRQFKDDSNECHSEDTTRAL